MPMLENTHLNPIKVKVRGAEHIFYVNSHTEYGDEQMLIKLPDGTRLEITHKKHGLKEKDWYYTMRHHTILREKNDSEKYGSTLASFTYGDYKDLCRGVNIFSNNIYK